MSPAPATNKKTKTRSDSMMKAPGAPKRFKSSYILFFMSVQDNIKKSLPKDMANAPTVSKVVSRLWKNLSLKDRAYWAAEADKEKARFHREKEAYKGPWTVPKARAKKDPNAPRRNPSAFLLFSNQRRKELKGLYSHLRNTDFSRMLGIQWNRASVEEKAPFLRQEERERAIYKSRMNDWKRNKRVSDAEDSTNFCADTATESLVVSKPSQDQIDDQDSLVIPISLLNNLRTQNSKSKSSDCKNRSSLEVPPMNDVSLGESSLNNFDHNTNAIVPNATNGESFYTQTDGHHFHDSQYLQPHAIASDSFSPYHTNVMPKDFTFDSHLDSAPKRKNEVEIKELLSMESQKMITAIDTRSSTNSVTPPFSSHWNALIGDAETFSTYSLSSMKCLDAKPSRLIKRQGSNINIEVQNEQPTFTEIQAKMADIDTRSSTNSVTPPFSSHWNASTGDAETFSTHSLSSMKCLDAKPSRIIKRQGSNINIEVQNKQPTFSGRQTKMADIATRSSTNSITPPCLSRRNTLLVDAETFPTSSFSGMKFLDAKPSRLIKRQGSQMNSEVQNKQPTFSGRQAKMADIDTRSYKNTVTPPFSSRKNILLGDAETFSILSIGSLKLDDNDLSLKRPSPKIPCSDTPSDLDSSFQEFDPIYDKQRLLTVTRDHPQIL